MLDLMGTWFNAVDNNNISPEDLGQDLLTLYKDNLHISFARKMLDLKLPCANMMLLSFFCSQLINEDDSRICDHQFKCLYERYYEYRTTVMHLAHGAHILAQMGLIEPVCEEGRASTTTFTLTSKAKSELLAEFDLTEPEVKLSNVLYPDSITPKVLFYPKAMTQQIKELNSFLEVDKFKQIQQRMLDSGFRTWVNEENLFCSTLVDRIVPGRIRDPKEAEALAAANGYEDPLTDVGEFFGIWVIEGPQELEERLPFRKAGVPVIVVPDVTPYKKRKVRILNGAHTGFVPGAYMAGYDIVRDCMHDETILGYMNRMLYDEVIPTLPLEKKDLEDFARAVQDRFNNPFVNHELMSISLNSTSKWRARNMPSFLDYVQGKGKLPPCLTTSFAAYVAFYSSEPQALTEQGLICRRPKGNEYTVNDDRSVLEFYWQHRNDSPEELIHAVMTNEDMWGTDLTKVNGFEAAAAGILKTIRTEGALKAFENCLA